MDTVAQLEVAIGPKTAMLFFVNIAELRRQISREDFIQVGKRAGVPVFNDAAAGDTVGRAAKVGKEQIMALLAALEAYLRRDHDADQRRWRNFLARIASDVRDIPTVESEIFVPVDRGFPYLRVRWGVQELGLSYESCREELLGGAPRIAVAAGPDGVEIASINLSSGEERIIGLRLSEVLRQAAAG